MGEITVEDYLTYIPVGVVQSRHSSSTKTTFPTHPRDLEGVEICEWKSFGGTVLSARSKALNTKSKMVLYPLMEREADIDRCANETQVEMWLDRRLFQPLTRLMGYLGLPGQFMGRPDAALLDPDYGWTSQMMQNSTSATEVLYPPNIATGPYGSKVVKILIEVKTFWAFDPPDDLVAALKLEMSSRESQVEESGPPDKRLKTDNEAETREKIEGAVKTKDEAKKREKIERAVTQIHGYMTVNHLQYGVIATYEKFFFMHRLVGEQHAGRLSSKLEITKVIRRDQTRHTSDFTLMEAWVSLIMAAEVGHVFISPYSSPIWRPLTQALIPKTMRMELLDTARIGDLYFGERITRSQLGNVVKGGISGHDEKNSVMKIVDAMKSPEMAKKLMHEFVAYRVLDNLQETVVPWVHGCLVIQGWIMVLVLSYCGDPITHDQFVESYENIKSMVHEMHNAGVVHGDLQYRNILLSTKGEPTIIDFSEAFLRTDCSEEEFSRYCGKDWKRLNSLFSE